MYTLKFQEHFSSGGGDKDFCIEMSGSRGSRTDKTGSKASWADNVQFRLAGICWISGNTCGHVEGLTVICADEEVSIASFVVVEIF